MAIEIEVATIAQVREALWAEPSWIMLDNMTVPQLAEAGRLRRELAPDSDIRLEAAGTVTLDKMRAALLGAIDEFEAVGEGPGCGVDMAFRLHLPMPLMLPPSLRAVYAARSSRLAAV